MPKFVLVTQPGCRWCERAVEALDSRGLPYSLVNLATHAEVKTFFKDAGFETVPQVFYDGRHIGGCTDLLAFIDKESQ